MNQNKLIAEFMGLQFSKGEYYRPLYNSGDWIPENELQYHTSWDWLMPVVEKIENLGYELIIAESRCKINHNTDHSIEEVINIDIIGSKIDVTYQAVVEFIEGLSVKSVEPDTKAVDEAFFAGFCHALEYVKREIENVGDIEHEVDESVGDLHLSGTIYIQLDQHLDADGVVDEVMRKYERDTPKDGSNV